MTTTPHVVFDVPDLVPIVEALDDARRTITASEPAWAESILTGDTLALEAADRLQTAVNGLCEALTALAGVDVDLSELEAVLGAVDVIAAAEVAHGRDDHPDPAVMARFRPARLAVLRAQYELSMRHHEAVDTDDARRWVDECRAAIASIDAGIDPA